VGSCSFTALPLRVSGEGLTPEQLTAANMDKSAALDSLIRDQYDGDERELLAEFQTAFLNFVLGHSLQAYAQWKDFLVLVCSCAQAISPRHGRSGLICSFAKTLRVQLQVTLEAEASTPSGMMGDATPFGVPMVEELLAASFLRPLLGGYPTREAAREGAREGGGTGHGTLPLCLLSRFSSALVSSQPIETAPALSEPGREVREGGLLQGELGVGDCTFF